MMAITKCCWVWKLETCCVVVGYTSVAICAIIAMGCVIRLIIGIPDVLRNEELEGNMTFNFLLFLFPTLYCILRMMASFLLVTAVEKENALFIIPWIVTGFVDISLNIIAVGVLCHGPISGKLYTDGILFNVKEKLKLYQCLLFVATALSCILLPLLIYIQICVISYYQLLSRSKGIKSLQASMEDLWIFDIAYRNLKKIFNLEK